MKRIIMLIVSGGVVLLAFALMYGRSEIVFSTQMGYWSSVAVIALSFRNYREMVRRRLEYGMTAVGEDRDAIEKIEDPFGLYGDEEDKNGETLSFKEVLKEEKDRLRRSRRSPMQTLRDSAPAFSILRLGAYLLLVAGFFYLKDREKLHVASYLFSLGLPIILTVWALMGSGGKDVEEA